MRDFYKTNLLELNYGITALSPEGAAYVVNTLVQPASVIMSHVNEAATTRRQDARRLAHAPSSPRW